MFRLWGKEFKDNRMLRDTVICDDTEDTRTPVSYTHLDVYKRQLKILQGIRAFRRQRSAAIIEQHRLWQFIQLRHRKDKSFDQNFS